LNEAGRLVFSTTCNVQRYKPTTELDPCSEYFWRGALKPHCSTVTL